FGVDVELAVAEAVDPPDLTGNGTVVAHLGQRHQPGYEPRRIDGSAQVGQRDAGGEVPGRRGEDDAPSEGRAGRGELVLEVVERDHRTGAARHGHRRGEEAIVGAEQHSARDFYAHQTAVGADAGVDHGDQHAVVREVLHRPHEQQGAGAYVV